MCGFGSAGCINLGYVRDLYRGRMRPDRFRKIDDYAYRRWEASRDMRAASRWLSVLKLVAERSPVTGHHFKRTWREA